MLGRYLKLRFKLLLKASSHSLDIGVLITGLIIFLFLFKVDNNNWFALVSASILCIIHFIRKDIIFLKNTLGKQFYTSLIVEYLIISIFINIFFIFKASNFLFLGNIFLCFVLPLFQRKNYFINPRLIHNIPNILLEWKSFLRKNIIVFSCFELLSIFLGYHPATIMFFLLSWIYILLAVYAAQENKEMLILQFSAVSLQKKIIYSYLFSLILSAPAMILFIFFNPLEKQYILYFSIYLFLSNSVIIINKYLKFNEKIKINYTNDADFFKFSLIILLVIPAVIYIIYNKKIVLNKIDQYV